MIKFILQLILMIITFCILTYATIVRADDCSPMYLRNHTFQSNGYYEENGTVKFYWAAKDYDGDGEMDAYFQIYKLITLTRADLCIRPLTNEQLNKLISGRIKKND